MNILQVNQNQYRRLDGFENPILIFRHGCDNRFQFLTRVIQRVAISNFGEGFSEVDF